MQNDGIRKFGYSYAVGQEIIKIVETGKLVRWLSFDPKTREYEVQSRDGVIKVHETKTTKLFTRQEELNFRNAEGDPK
jgi:hypothetical protein